jgi:type I restriction enzyme S subunit
MRKLPDNWRETTVDDVCETVSVGIVVRPAQYYTDAANGVRAFRSQNVGEGYVKDRGWVYLTVEGHEKNSKSKLQEGDVLVVRTGAPGVACVVSAKYSGSNCVDLVFARPKSESVCSDFLAYVTNSDFGRNQIQRGVGGLAQQHFNVSEYKELKLRLPPRAEQRRITEILLTWDESIEKIERLITAMAKRLLWLSEAALFGRLRLGSRKTNGRHKHRWFSLPTDWASPRISEFAQQVNLANSSGAVATVLSCTKHEGLVESLTYFGRQVFSADTSAYKIIERGQFAYATNHLEEGSIGYQDFCDKGLVSPMYTVFKTDPSKVNDHFLWKLFKTSVYLHIFRASTSSSVDRRGGLRWEEFGKLRVPLPSLAEQAEIVTVLSLARREINLLKLERDNLDRQKRGLMQKLLTGEWQAPLRDADIEVMAERAAEEITP